MQQVRATESVTADTDTDIPMATQQFDPAPADEFDHENKGGAELAPLEREVDKEDDDDDGELVQHAKSSCKRQKNTFPWEYVRDWVDGDSAKENGKRQCTLC